MIPKREIVFGNISSQSESEFGCLTGVESRDESWMFVNFYSIFVWPLLQPLKHIVLFQSALLKEYTPVRGMLHFPPPEYPTADWMFRRPKDREWETQHITYTWPLLCSFPSFTLLALSSSIASPTPLLAPVLLTVATRGFYTTHGSKMYRISLNLLYSNCKNVV